MYRVTTNGIKKGDKPFEIICKTNPFTATLKEFKRLLKIRCLEFPKDLVCKNGTDKIVFEYSFLEANEFKEFVQLVFKIECLND